MAFVVFPAGPADAEAIARVHVAAWRETYRGLISTAYLDSMSEAALARRWAAALLRPHRGELVLAAASRSGVVGYCSAGPSRLGGETDAEVATLYLLRAAQGAGLGRALLESAARALAAEGFSSLMISVLQENRRARAFYEHMGGLADPPRPEPGPGGVLNEVAYRWPDIRTLT